MRYLITKFTDATNPALTPDPWDSIVEGDATVNVLYGATSGYGGAKPGMRVLFNGAPTASSGYGRCLFTAANRSQFFLKDANPALLTTSPPEERTHFRVNFAMNLPTVTGLATDDEIKIVRVNYDTGDGTQAELCSLSWVKKGGTNFALKLSDGIFGTTPVTSANITASAYSSYFLWTLDIVMVYGVAFVNIGEAWPFTNTTAGTAPNTFTKAVASLAFPTTASIPAPSSVDMGYVSGPVPSNAVELDFDLILIEDDVYKRTHGAEKVIASSASGSYPIDNMSCRVPYGYFFDVGAITPELGGYEVQPPLNISVVPCGVYEFSFTFAEEPPGEPGTGDLGSDYISIQPYQHSSEYFTFASPEYATRYPIGGHTVTKIWVPEGCNAIRVYNGSWTDFECFVKRVA